MPHKSGLLDFSSIVATIETASMLHETITRFFADNGISGSPTIVAACSGGVDSTFLMKVAHDTLGDRAIAVTAISESIPEAAM